MYKVEKKKQGFKRIDSIKCYGKKEKRLQVSNLNFYLKVVKKQTKLK